MCHLTYSGLRLQSLKGDSQRLDAVFYLQARKSIILIIIIIIRIIIMIIIIIIIIIIMII